jgi:hypothetical protein
VQRVDLPDRWFVISAEQVAYAFLGSAVSHGGIEGPWTRELAPGSVYVRTIKGGLFRAGCSTLAALRELLGRDPFVPIDRLILVNVGRLVELDLEGSVNRVGVMVGTEVEFLRVSRRRLRALRELVGLPRRVTRRLRRPVPDRSLPHRDRSTSD